MSRRGRGRLERKESPRLRGKSRGANPWPARLKLGGVLAALVLVNLYIFVWRKETSLGSLMSSARSASIGQPVDPLRPGQPVTKAAAVNPEAAAIAEESGGKEMAETQPPIPDMGTVAPEEATAAEAAPVARTLEGMLGKRDTLSAALGRAGMAGPQKEELLRALRKVLDVRRVREGQRFTLQLTESSDLVEFIYEASPIESYRVARGAGGELQGRRERQKLRKEVVKLGGTVTRSLHDSISRTGEKTTLVAFFVDVFAWDINFFTDTRPGDGFKMLVEKLYNGDTFYRYGRVLAAEYIARSKGKTYRAFWYQPPCADTAGGAEGEGDERRGRCPEGGYYDELARSIQKTQLKTPLKYVRITSKFTPARFHPILHTVRSHMGVDYAAPTGTPVWATTPGRIVSRSYAGGAGNMVVLSHAGGTVSIYMHLSRFAAGQKVGDRVRQKQVIGYVGSTGLSTGPHLHFAMKVKGRYVNPLAQKISSSGPPLSSAHRARFQAELQPRLAALESISLSESNAQVAEADPAAATAGGAGGGPTSPARPGTAAQ
jgi:murein DD-endopeptidase MepM/ murein hydrolase activator NlpD